MNQKPTKSCKICPIFFFLYAIATKTASANVKSHIEKNEKKIFYETAKIYLYNLKKIFDANLVVD